MEIHISVEKQFALKQEAENKINDIYMSMQRFTSPEEYYFAPPGNDSMKIRFEKPPLGRATIWENNLISNKKVEIHISLANTLLFHEEI